MERCDGCGLRGHTTYADDALLCDGCFAEAAGLHLCEKDLPWDAYGAAVERCVERTDGTLWVDNGEYASQVWYCPYCGLRSPVNVDYEGWREDRGGVYPE